MATAPPAAPAPATGFTASSLYVGDLEPNVTEAQLYELFSSIGPVVSIRVCRDLITRRSLGYAYVNYQQATDASHAIDVLNFQVVNSKPIRIMFSQRDPASRKSGVGNIFIKNLDKEIDNKALHDTFAQFGGIISAKIAAGSDGQSKGYGFVQFASEEEAVMAIEKVNGMMLMDKQVYVGPFQRRNERPNGDTKFNNIYVKNIAESVSNEKLTEEFAKCGTITSCVVMKDADGKSKGFGFVCYEDSEAAAAAVEKLNGFEVDEKAWVVCRAQKKGEREQELKAKFDAERRERMEKMAGANLYIKNLEDTVDDEKLRELFKDYGTITSCRVMKDHGGQTRGSGFVAFGTAEEATRAVTEMNGKMIGLKPLYVALAQRKEDRRVRLQAQFAQRAAIAGGAVPSNMAYMPPPGAPMYYGQPPPGVMNPQQQQFAGGFQPVIPPGARPGMPGLPQYVMPVPQRQQGGPGRSGRTRSQQPPGGRGGGRQQQQQNLRYNANVRNVGEPPMPGMPMPGAQPELPPQGIEQNPVAMLAAQLPAVPPEQQRMLLGEALYPLVEALEPVSAAKVTGMLLEMDQSEVLHLIESPEALRSKVVEAMSVLKAAQQAGAISGATDAMSGMALAE